MRLYLDPGTEYLLPFAKKKLQELTEVGIPSRLIQVSSGEEIYVERGEVDTIRIRAAGYEMAVLANDNTPPVIQLRNFITTAPMITAAGLPVGTPVPPPSSIRVVNDKLVASTEVDWYVQRIGMVKRAIRNGAFEYAERLIRSIDQDGSLNDGAVNFDEGFLVDSAVFTGKSYYDALFAAVGPSHTSAFSHDLLSVPGIFPEIDQSTLIPAVPPDNATAHQFFAGGARLRNTEYFGLGSGVLNYILTSTLDRFPAGTRITTQRILIASGAVTFNSNTTKYVDQVAMPILHFAENYYDVDTEPSVMLAPHTSVVSDPRLVGPVNGYALPRAVRIKYRRTPSGWTTLESTAVSPTAIMPMTKDGNFPAATLLAPADSTTVSQHIDGGVTTTYARATYLASAVSYTQGANTSPSIYLTATDEPRGTAGGPGSLNIYPLPIPTFTAPVTNLVLERLTTSRSTFTRSIGNIITITDNQTGIVTTINPTTSAVPTSLDRAPTAEKKVYDYPFAATSTDMNTAARINTELHVFQPTRVAQNIFAPPILSDLFCIIRPRTGQYLYFRYVTPGFAGVIAAQAAQQALTVALTTGQPASVIAAKKAALIAVYNFVADGGLPREFVLFAPLVTSVPVALI